MNVLFICNQNKHRSKTAEELFRALFQTRSAGLYNKIPVTEQQLDWADVVVVMEDEQRTEIGRRFPKQYNKKSIISLGIPDVFSYQQPALCSLLEQKMRPYFNHS